MNDEGRGTWKNPSLHSEVSNLETLSSCVSIVNLINELFRGVCVCVL